MFPDAQSETSQKKDSIKEKQDSEYSEKSNDGSPAKHAKLDGNSEEKGGQEKRKVGHWVKDNIFYLH